MRLIAVDIGNGSVKFAVTEQKDAACTTQRAIANSVAFDSSSFGWLDDAPHFWSVCSVHPTRTDELRDWVLSHRTQDYWHLIQPDDIPLATDVQSRPSLGRDRLLAAWQARQMFPDGRLVVIDAGTAVTVDLVTEDSVFSGGLIFPGARTVLRALAKQTAALPDLSEQGIRGAFDSDSEFEQACQTKFPVVGKSTRQAILRGVYITQISTLVRVVEQLAAHSSTPMTVVLTGGGITELLPWLPGEWNHEPHLLIRGVQSIGRILLEKHFHGQP